MQIRIVQEPDTRNQSERVFDDVNAVTFHVDPQYSRDGFVLIQAGTFCGKAATASVYVNPANMPKLLAA